jgi:TRAP-type C4-dicarboxylate transport system permease small subunit
VSGSEFRESWKRIDAGIRRATEIVLLVIGVTFTVLICLQVVSRFVFDFSIFAINALARFLLLWFFFLGMGLALRKKLHVGFELIQRSMPPLAKRLAEGAVHLCIFVFCLEILWAGLLALPPSLRQIDGSLEVSTFWAVVSIPVGIALLIYHQVMIVLERPPWRSQLHEGKGPEKAKAEGVVR